jgi:hypothetical protein
MLSGDPRLRQKLIFGGSFILLLKAGDCADGSFGILWIFNLSALLIKDDILIFARKTARPGLESLTDLDSSGC